METTLTLAQHFGTTPFVLFEQGVDEVIMIINHFIAKSAVQKNTAAVEMDEKAESKSFWACI